MNKIWLIIQREYISRVKKKSFLVTTLLIPILMFGLIATMAYMAAKSEQKEAIAVIDESGVFINKMDTSSSSYTITYIADDTHENYTTLLEKNKCDILLHIYPFRNGLPDSVNIYKDGGVSLSAKEFISDDMNTIYQIKQMQDEGIDKDKIDSINNSSIRLKSFDLKNNQETSSEIATMIGYVTGFLIYLVILIYGMGVMRGVMEEKTNRIAEVIISSVRPFQLMMGKIVGIALVGLTQFLLWLILTGSLQFLLPLFIPELRQAMHPSSAVGMDAMSKVPTSELAGIFNSLSNQHWSLILSCFLFYFLGGYFLYAAMFAAVGSLVNEDQQEAQQMTIPITMPIILAFFIMTSAIKDPNSTLAIFGSMFPLTSPIVMMARIPYGVPAWQIATSMLLLVAGFVLMTWLSAKIYRTGILMYGKKASWKEIIKWMRYH
ncbi:MAG: ABC transporter permease [Chitinophagaceae bacterium]|nr:ABC transporter permease [Chitinophagaceae bacterium]